MVSALIRNAHPRARQFSALNAREVEYSRALKRARTREEIEMKRVMTPQPRTRAKPVDTPERQVAAAAMRLARVAGNVTYASWRDLLRAHGLRLLAEGKQQPEIERALAGMVLGPGPREPRDA